LTQEREQKPRDHSTVQAAIQARFQQGLALHQQGRLADAERIYRGVLHQDPNHFGALHLLGALALQTRRTEQGADLIRKAIALDASVPAAYSNLGAALLDLKRPEEALANFDRAIALNPEVSEAHSNRAAALCRLNRHEEAIASSDRAIALKPDNAEAHANRGVALNGLKRHEEAVASYDRAIALRPDFANAHNDRGIALVKLRRNSEALASFDTAIALRPGFPEAHNNRGNALNNLMRYREALASFDQALALKPDFGEVHNNRGDTLSNLKRPQEAADAYAEWLKIDPQHPFTKGKYLHQKMLVCDWREIDRLITDIDKDIASGKFSAEPFGWLGVAKSQHSHRLCAELYNKKMFPGKGAAAPRFGRHDKIRIGYSSGEFRDQATSHLLIGVLEQHDRSRFEIYGVDNGWNDDSELRRRIDASLHSIIEISHLSDAAAAATIRQQEMDILVNLNGYFGLHRTAVFAERAAPIQVNYLGYPGTLGASYVDYIMADRHVIPPGHEQFYTEKIVYLPDCYQANDNRRRIETPRPDRAPYGLPPGGVVFCCFNNSYKITPETFDSWMRILRHVEGSILWLLQNHAGVVVNLTREAIARGVDPARLVFAERTPLADHLARQALADLFLDTWPCNAHTTASDALWAGLPVLTHIGETFAGKVAASLLHAIGLPELIASTQQDYEALAIELAANPEKLRSLRRKLVANRLTTPLFDTERLTRHIEAAYLAMYERCQAGLPPDHIFVPRQHP
jgi:predicted O-linked N-acetylglucosamine transferase (SPINDLY family)